MSISRWMDKKAVVHIHNGVLLSHSKEYIWISSNEVDETRFFLISKKFFCLKHLTFIIFIFYWRIIALQNFALFCQTSTWISHRYTYIPSFLKLLPISLPIPPFRLLQRPCLSFLSHIESSCWLSILHMVMQISMLLFPYSSPSPALSPCPWVCSLCLFLHCCCC